MWQMCKNFVECYVQKPHMEHKSKNTFTPRQVCMQINVNTLKHSFTLKQIDLIILYGLIRWLDIFSHTHIHT